MCVAVSVIGFERSEAPLLPICRWMLHL